MDKETYRRQGHTVSACRYHFVWTPKYRHDVLDLVVNRLKELFHGTAERFNHEIISLKIPDDNIHLFVECDPKYSPSMVAKQFKGYSGKRLLEEYPVFRENYF